jgi:dihydroorotate dehydrogenase electron transfer subunit
VILQSSCPVDRVREVGDGIFVLSFQSPVIAHSILPGQFVNIKPDEATDPLLRRPFSVYRTDGDAVEIIFQVVGKGTAVLRSKQKGDPLDVLGPLGMPYRYDLAEFETAIVVGGGLGVAPLPVLTEALKQSGKKIITLLGARTAGQLVVAHLDNLHTATDDGTSGFHGTVVDLLTGVLHQREFRNPKIFACGPTPMLRALAALAEREEIGCEVSMEGPMACGFGICQGCPVETVSGERKYLLMCKDGPTFDARTIRI